MTLWEHIEQLLAAKNLTLTAGKPGQLIDPIPGIPPSWTRKHTRS